MNKREEDALKLLVNQCDLTADNAMEKSLGYDLVIITPWGERFAFKKSVEGKEEVRERLMDRVRVLYNVLNPVFAELENV